MGKEVAKFVYRLCLFFPPIHQRIKYGRSVRLLLSTSTLTPHPIRGQLILCTHSLTPWYAHNGTLFCVGQICMQIQICPGFTMGVTSLSIIPHRASVPGCRYGHTVCQYKGKLYMYGGRNDEDGSFSDVDCYDTGEHWNSLQEPQVLTIWYIQRCKFVSRDKVACNFKCSVRVGPPKMLHAIGMLAASLETSRTPEIFTCSALLV